MFEGIHKNPFFIAINILIITGQVLIISFGGSALSATQLSAKEWAITLAIGVMCMPVAMLIRLIPDESLRRLFDMRQLWRKKAAGKGGPDALDGSQWFQALENVRCELLTIRQPRSSRLQRLRDEIYDLAKTKIFGESCDSDGAVDERSPLLQRPSSVRDRSRASSIMGPSVVMAGLVAGGVAGWPRSPTLTDETSR